MTTGWLDDLIADQVVVGGQTVTEDLVIGTKNGYRLIFSANQQQLFVLSADGLRVSVGSITADPSALLDLVSTNKGFGLPAMTTAQRNAIGSPRAGLTIFNSTASEIQFWTGAAWLATSGAVAAHAASHLPGGADALATSTPVPIQVGDATSAGAAASFAKSDHRHNLTAPGAPTNPNSTAASAGASLLIAREDHSHLASALQSAFSEITVDTTTTSTTFVDLLSVVVTTLAGTKLLIHASTSASNTGVNGEVRFRVTIDGTAVRGWSNVKTGAGQTASGGFTYRKTGLSAAAHTIKVQWLVDAGTGRIRPATAAIDIEHASLLCQEVLF